MSDYADDDEDVYCWLCDQRIADDKLCTLVGYVDDDGTPDVEIVHEHCLLAQQCSPDVRN